LRTASTFALAALTAVLLTVVPANAAPTPATGPTAAPTKPTKKSSFSISLGGTYRTHGRSYVLPRSRVTVKGSTAADLAGETVAIEITKKGRVAKTDRVKLVSRGGKATFTTAFSAGKKGKYVVKLALTDAQAELAEAGRGKSLKIVKTGIHNGSRGISVKVYQNKLGSLGYVVPHNGKFDGATGRAFMAYRKVTGLKRTFSAGKAVASKLAKGKGTFKLRYPKAGRHVEVSIRRQVMVFSDNGKVQRIYHVSTGSPATPTVRGTYHVYSKDPGTNAKGMVKSNYFIRGYAIHGYAEVPPYNASHGCVRVPVPNAASIYAWVHMGTRVDVYY
jgi:hypothetical protein